MKATQLAIYRDEICRLHHTNDALAASNQTLRDALGAVRADCAAEVARTKAEMAPGFSWPDRDSAVRLSAKLKELRAEMAGMATRLAKTAAERDKAIEERDYLRRRHAHHNTSGKNAYTEHRSHVNDEIKKVEAELAAELGAEAAGPGDAGAHPNNAKGRAGAGHSHSNKPHKKVWHILEWCPHCHTRGRLRQGRALTSLCNDFDGNGMYIRTTAHIGYEYTCSACGEGSHSRFPRVSGTSFGRKALGIMVRLGGKKCVDADIAEIFGDVFGFPTGETTIWNARRAAADLLDPTIHFILEELKKAKFLGIDETPYSVNGERGYVWVVRTDRATLVLAMPTRAGAVIAEHMAELLHIPVTTDGYSPYLTIPRYCRGAGRTYSGTPRPRTCTPTETTGPATWSCTASCWEYSAMPSARRPKRPAWAAPTRPPAWSLRGASWTWYRRTATTSSPPPWRTPPQPLHLPQVSGDAPHE